MYQNTDSNGSSWMEDQIPTAPCLLISDFTPLDLQMLNRLRKHEMIVSSLVLPLGLNLLLLSSTKIACR